MDDIRENEGQIENLEYEIEVMKKELKQRKKKRKELKQEEKKVRINLCEQGKIRWVECNLNEWREYVESNLDDPADYYRYYYDGGIQQQGYYEGVYKLNDDDTEHFEKYFNDYFYYGCPCYQDANDPNVDGSECYLAFGSGDAYVLKTEWEI
jgi:hypothetical protein